MTLNCDVTSLTAGAAKSEIVNVAVPPLAISGLPTGLRRNSFTVALFSAVLFTRTGTVNVLVVSPGWNVNVPDTGV